MICMQTTIRVEEDVARLLEDIKRQEKAKSYNEIIKKLGFSEFANERSSKMEVVISN